MQSQRIIPLLLCLSFFVVVAPGADSKPQDYADLLQQAESKTDIFSLPSFEMKAAIRVDNKGKPLEGSYSLLWNGPDQWREEISFPGYSEVQVGGKGVIFIKRSTDFVPRRIDQLHSTLGFGSSPRVGSFFHLGPRPQETFKKKIKGRKVNGISTHCLEIVGQEKHERAVCIDESAGTLVRGDPFEDRGLVPIGSKYFPKSLTMVEEGKPVAEVDINELKPLRQPPPNSFDGPEGSVSKAGCMNPFPERRIRSAAPKYPEQDRQSRIQGAVAIYAVIARDGTLRELRVVKGLDPGLNDASMEATRLWLYEPATCDVVAVETETVITINYTFGR